MAWWKSLPTKGRTLLRLTAADHWTLGQAGLLLPLTVVAFRLVGFRRWQSTLQRWLPPAVAPGDEAKARRIAWLVSAAARLVAPANSCLSQSLVLWWLLRRRGLASELQIGVRKFGARLQAHAWVEYRSVVLNGRGDTVAPFVAFDRAIISLESGSA